jgi:signal recognition particle GTPase
VQRFQRHSTRALAAALVVIGVAMTVSALARGGGPLSLGVVLGVPLALLGIGRLVLVRAGGEPRPGA